jgi:hypothetical protein
MIETPTVLILGAGASKPYGYHLGIDLKNAILHKVTDMYKNDSGWIDKLGIDDGLVSSFINRLSESSRSSIDSFLNYHKDIYEEIGKIAIADVISNCESNKLFNQPLDENDNWYNYLVQFLYNCGFEDINKNKLGIITYNYDRSLESFLYNKLRRDYKEGDSGEECANKIKSIEIEHMYGRLDPLPWEAKGGRGYGQSCSSNQLLEISENIKLIQEAKREEIPKRADELIENARRIYFLGLDLRRQENLELLNLSNLQGKDIIGTAFGLEMSEISQIKKFLNNYSRTQNVINPQSGPLIEPEKSLSMIRKFMAFE